VTRLEICFLKRDEGDSSVQSTLDAWKERMWGEPRSDGIQWSTPDWHTLLPSRSEYVSRAGIVIRSIDVGHRSLAVAGICEVATKSEHRGSGLASQVLRHAAGFIRDELALPFGLLLCEEEMIPFFERFGWQWIDESPVCALPDVEGELSQLRCMVLECTDAAWPAGPIHLRGLPC